MTIKHLAALALALILGAFGDDKPAEARGATEPKDLAGEAKRMAEAGYLRIEPGVFVMGSPPSEEGHWDDEGQREVRITRAFWLKSTEVTQGEWQAVMGSNPSHFDGCGERCPVEYVSWEDAVAYLNKLSEREGLEACYPPGGSFKGLTCRGYRLPTEAEWEYAARAGTTGARYGSLDDVAWYGATSGGKTHPVGQKAPNAWGLYDMLGNVAEWVHDWDGPHRGGSATDPTGPGDGRLRVERGGNWYNDARDVRAANRVSGGPANRSSTVGFRPARSVPHA